MEEKEWVIAAQQGDVNAFGELYERYAKRLYHYALCRLANPDDAQEAVQDCALKAWQHLPSLKQPAAFSAWLFKIQHRCCNRKISEQAKRRSHKDIEHYANYLTSDSVSAETAVALKNALAQLSEKDREIVLLSVVAGMKSTEIAKIVRLTPANVRQRLHRSLEKMKRELEE